MSALSEVSVLIGQRAGDLEKAREIFTAEIRSFVSGILAGIQRVRSDPWTAARVRLDIPRVIENEAKATGYFSSQFALARVPLRFKKGTNFREVAEVRFGIEFDEATDAFAWQISLVPAARYQRIDDLIWHGWKAQAAEALRPGAAHQEKANTVRFLMRPIGGDLTAEAAYNDVKAVLEFVMSADAALAEAVGLDAGGPDEAGA
jgi:hypothetical protein